MDNGEKIYDVLIIGGGPAGLTAAIYAGRAKLSALVIERENFGGAAAKTADLVNYPGILPGETGLEFSARLETQAWSFGAEKVYGDVQGAELAGPVKEVACGGNVYKGRTLIIASGKATDIPAKLKIPGEEDYLGRGVSYCAICDGPFFTDSRVFVVGGGDSALEESLYLAGVAKQVTIIYGGEAFEADKKYIDLVSGKENISFMMDTVVTDVGGGDLLTRIETKNTKTGEKSTIEAASGENFGLFIYAGTEPAVGVFGDTLETEKGYIITDEEMHTNIPGVFAAGDVRKKAFRQAVMAAADGATAALFAGKYLIEEKKKNV